MSHTKQNQKSETDAKLKEVMYKNVYGDLRQIARQITQDVLLALNAELDEVHFSGAAFRHVIESTTWRVMQHIDRSSERIGIYEEALPGFTLMVFKKNDGPIQESSADRFEKSVDEVSSSEEMQAAEMLMENFFSKTQKNIMTIEHEHVIIIMFPVSDTKKHLKTIGLWGEAID
jgi:hypothetical protein